MSFLHTASTDKRRLDWTASLRLEKDVCLCAFIRVASTLPTSAEDS